MTAATVATTVLGSGRMIAFGTPGMPLAMLGLPMVMLLPAAYIELPTISAAQLGIALLLTKLWDVASDPLIGALGDRMRGPLRRRVLLLAGTPVLLAGLGTLAYPPPDAGIGHLVLGTLIFYTGWTLVTIPLLAWGAELSYTPQLQTGIASAREAWVVAGLIASVTLILPAAGTDPFAALERLSLWSLALLPLAVVLVSVSVPEAPARIVTRRLGNDLAHLWRRDTRLLFGAFVLNGVANAIPAALFLLFVTHVLRMPGQITTLLVCYFGAGLIGLVAWQPAIRRFGATTAWIVSMVLATLAFVAVPWLGPGDFWPFALVCLASGLSVGVDMALPTALQARLLRATRAGRRRAGAGVVFGAWGMATKLAMALGVGIAFPLLELFGFDPDLDNDETALTALALTYGALPVLFKAAAIAVTVKFALREEIDNADQQQTGIGAPLHPAERHHLGGGV